MNPNRRPEWRRNLAGDYRKQSGAFDFDKVEFEENEDKFIVKYTEYLFYDAAHKTGARKKYPFIHDARMIFYREDQFSPRWVIEALALTDLSDKEIADYAYIEKPEIVNTFCKLFFDVRDKDTKKVYIRNISGLCESIKNVERYDMGWKYIAGIMGFEFFDSTVFNRSKMTRSDKQDYDTDRVNMQAQTAWWTTFKRYTLIDETPDNDLKVLLEKQNLDLGSTASPSAGQVDGGPSEDDAAIIKAVKEVEGLVVLADPDKIKSTEKEARLTKKKR